VLLGESFLNWLVGRPESDGEVQLQWLNLPSSWGVFVMLAIVATVVVVVYRLYRRENVEGPTWMRPLLITLRLLTLLFLLLLFLQPSISLLNRIRLRPSIAIARDSSASMARKDRLTDPNQSQKLAALTGFPQTGLEQGNFSRQELVNRLIGDGRGQWITDLRKKGAVRIVDFASDLKNVTTLPAIDENLKANDSQKNDSESKATTETNSTADDSTTPSDEREDSNGSELRIRPLTPDGVSTNLSRMLAELLSEDSNVGSIVLISDGQHNSSEDPIALAQKAARRDIPIYVIGIGDPTRPRNISVEEVYVRSKVRPEEPFEIEALVRGEDLETGAVELKLVEQPLDPKTKKPLGEERALETKPLQLEGQGRTRVSFQHSQMEPGLYAYRISAEPVRNEVSEEDNIRTSLPVEVIDDRVKVLLIAGGPQWDYQQVMRLLQRDSSIVLSCWLQSLDPERPQEGNESLKTLPRTLEELGQYNVVIMMDPDPTKDFDVEFMESLEKFLDTKAGGLLYMAGPQFSTEFLGRTTTGKIGSFLPVQIGDAEQLDFQTTLAESADLMEAGVLVAETINLEHPIMSFHADPAKNQAQWEQIPNVFWTFPVVSAKPATKVLLKKVDPIDPTNNQPLLVSGRYGAGSVLFFAFNSTWRWRSVGIQAQYFDRFWIQVIRFLVESRSLQGQRQALLETDRLDYDLGDRVKLSAKVLDSQFQPLNDEKIVASVVTSDEVVLPLELRKVPGQSGEYQGVFVPQSTGQFSISLTLPDSAGGADASDDQTVQPASFRVKAPSVEAATYWLNEALLKKVAQVSGGKYFSMAQWQDVATQVPEKISETQYESRPEPLWDQTRWLRWSFFAIPVLLLSLEWALRKRAKLL